MVPGGPLTDDARARAGVTRAVRRAAVVAPALTVLGVGLNIFCGSSVPGVVRHRRHPGDGDFLAPAQNATPRKNLREFLLLFSYARFSPVPWAFGGGQPRRKRRTSRRFSLSETLSPAPPSGSVTSPSGRRTRVGGEPDTPSAPNSPSSDGPLMSERMAFGACQLTHGR